MYIRTGLGTLRSIRERLSQHLVEFRNPWPLVPGLELDMGPGVAEALARVGRCEDLAISPSGTRLAIVGFHSRLCLVLALDGTEGSDTIAIPDFVEIVSPAVTQPHGVDWLDDASLVVANRDGAVAILDVPCELGGRHLQLDARSIVRGKGFSRLAWPGSVAVLRGPANEPSLLVCNNYIDRVSQHFLDPATLQETRSRTVFARGTHVPDGIAISPDGAHIAISCHGGQKVVLYATGRMGRLAAPKAILMGAFSPHGLRFTPDGEHLLVADAGSPYVHVYPRGNGWDNRREPAHSVQVVDGATYIRGRTQPDEGGPKGIDIHVQHQLVALCSQELGLKIVPLRALVAPAAGGEAEPARPTV